MLNLKMNLNKILENTSIEFFGLNLQTKKMKTIHQLKSQDLLKKRTQLKIISSTDLFKKWMHKSNFRVWEMEICWLKYC
jgi:hypothetical protein